MWSNFNILPKTNQTSMTNFLAVFYRKMVAFKTACLVERQLYLASVIFHELCLGIYWKLIAKFHLLKIRTSIDIFSTERCKVSFGLKYIK